MDSAPPPSAQRGTTATPTAPPPVATSIGGRIARLLSGEPPPAVPPPIRPIIVEGPSLPRFAADCGRIALRERSVLAESAWRSGRAVDIQLAGLKESTTAYERAGRLQEGVAEQLKEIDELTRTHSGRVPMVRRRLYSEEAAQAVSMIGNPATCARRHCSLIFGPPRHWKANNVVYFIGIQFFGGVQPLGQFRRPLVIKSTFSASRACGQKSNAFACGLGELRRMTSSQSARFPSPAALHLPAGHRRVRQWAAAVVLEFKNPACQRDRRSTRTLRVTSTS